jgi:hypothetical protein
VLAAQLYLQERRIAELESQLVESQQQLEAAQANRTVTQEALDQVSVCSGSGGCSTQPVDVALRLQHAHAWHALVCPPPCCEQSNSPDNAGTY